MDKEELSYWLALCRVHSVGPSRFQKIFSYFANIKEAWHAPFIELIKTGIEEKVAFEIQLARKTVEPEKELAEIEKEKISVVSLIDENYPQLLCHIPSPPPLLFYLGSLGNTFISLAVVGTRKMTPYGREVTYDLTYALAQQGILIVSGLALGVDAIAHQAALDAHGKTIAVLASGLDKNNIYPSSNQNLSEKILENGGALVSEYLPGIPSHKMNFPQRNRIISGLCRGTLITEAPEKSGALITAHFSLEQNREVFAVPGSIYSQNSVGVHSLLKMGARLVSTADDILEAYDIPKESVPKQTISPDLTHEENRVFLYLSQEPIHIDELIRASRLAPSEIVSLLVILEMKGAVKSLGNGIYRRV